MASAFLVAVLISILFVDYATLRKRGARILAVEVAVFALGGLVVVVPDLSQWLAAMVGIGRGADFVLYLTSIWLVRESILSRHMRWQESQRMADLVRELAMRDAERRTGTQ